MRREHWQGHDLAYCATPIATSDVAYPAVKLRCSFLRENLSNCRASISKGLIQFHLEVSVSFAEENMHSQGTDVAWTGRKSIAITNRVGNSFLLAYSTAESWCYLTERVSPPKTTGCQCYHRRPQIKYICRIQYQQMPNTCNKNFFSNTEYSTLNCVGHTLSPVTGACQTGAFDGAVAAINDVRLWYLYICKSHHLNIVHSE